MHGADAVYWNSVELTESSVLSNPPLPPLLAPLPTSARPFGQVARRRPLTLVEARVKESVDQWGECFGMCFALSIFQKGPLHILSYWLTSKRTNCLGSHAGIYSSYTCSIPCSAQLVNVVKISSIVWKSLAMHPKKVVDVYR